MNVLVAVDDLFTTSRLTMTSDTLPSSAKRGLEIMGSEEVDRFRFSDLGGLRSSMFDSQEITESCKLDSEEACEGKAEAERCSLKIVPSF